MKKNVKKLMTFDIGLYENLNKKAKRVGVSFQDYVKYILIQDFESYLPLEYPTQLLSKRVKAGLDDYHNGRFVEIKAGDEKALDKLLGIK